MLSANAFVGTTRARAAASLSPRVARAFTTVIRRDAPHYAGTLRQFVTAHRQLATDIVAPEYDAAAANPHRPRLS